MVPNPEAADLLFRLSLTLLVLNTALKVLSGVKRYREFVKAIEVQLATLAAASRPLDLAENSIELVKVSGSVCLSLFVNSCVARGLTEHYSPFMDAGVIKYAYASTLFVGIIGCSISIVLAILRLLGYWLLTALGLLLGLSNLVSGGRHLTFLSILVSLSGVAVYCIKGQGTEAWVSVATAVVTVAILEVILRWRGDLAQDAPYYGFTEDVAGSAVVSVVVVVACAVMTAIVYYGLSSAHNLLWLNNVAVDWGRPLPEPLKLGSQISIEDVEFGVVRHEGLWYRPRLVSTPVLQGNDIKKGMLGFAIRFKPRKRDLFVVLRVSSVPANRAIKTLVHIVKRHPPDVGWVVPSYPLTLIESVKTGQDTSPLLMQIGVCAFTFGNEEKPDCMYVAEATMAIRQDDVPSGHVPTSPLSLRIGMHRPSRTSD